MDEIEARHVLLRAIRAFFYDRGYTEVETPLMVRTVPPDPYIEPLQVLVGGKGPFFLHTSPEVSMKKLLARGHTSIFQICKVFREEEVQEVHSTEFTMLEWYRQGSYLDALEETRDLVEAAAVALGAEAWPFPPVSWPVHDLSRLCLETGGIDPLVLDREALFDALKKRGFAGIDREEPWEDLFFKFFIQEVEPTISASDPCFIKDWPVGISTMAKQKDEFRVERFEFYMKGLEIANGYTELLDPAEQAARFAADNRKRREQGRRTFRPDEEFLSCLAGIAGERAGVSLGIDRLLMALLDTSAIGAVLPLMVRV